MNCDLFFLALTVGSERRSIPFERIMEGVKNPSSLAKQEY
jgi:hypothetical protein